MADPRIPADGLGEIRMLIQGITARLRELEKPTGTQLSRIVDEVRALVEDLDQQVADYIVLYSYTRAQIEGLGWLSILPPGKGGTGTSNVYANQFTSGTYRTVWALTDGTLGWAPSLRALKQDIEDADIDVAAWLRLPVQAFRYRADVEENGEAAVDRLGFIAEDIEDAGLEPWLYRSPDGDLQGVAYELLPLAHHEIIRAQQARIDDLEQRLAALEGKE